MVKLAHAAVSHAKIIGWNGVSRISPLPELIGLDRFVQFSGDVVVVVGGTVELLQFTGPLSPLKCQLGVFGGQLTLSAVGIGLAQSRVGDPEIRVQFDGVFIERDGSQLRSL